MMVIGGTEGRSIRGRGEMLGNIQEEEAVEAGVVGGVAAARGIIECLIQGQWKGYEARIFISGFSFLFFFLFFFGGVGGGSL